MKIHRRSAGLALALVTPNDPRSIPSVVKHVAPSVVTVMTDLGQGAGVVWQRNVQLTIVRDRTQRRITDSNETRSCVVRHGPRSYGRRTMNPTTWPRTR
jgi:hypothetical protein